MAIKIKGVIGYDVRSGEFSERLSRLSGPVEFEIDSPGGSVFDGLAIYNAIKNYDRGKCTMHVVGQASSMAAYIMLAGDELPIFEPNAVCVLHNPWTIAVGDYKAFKKEADILERLADLYSEAFVKKGVFDKSEIRAIMDEETWFIGSNDLKRLGTVVDSENEDEGDETDRELKKKEATEKIEEAKAKLRTMEFNASNLDKIAALLPQAIHEAKTIVTVEANKNPNSQTEKKGENKMVKDLKELKAESPSVYNDARNEGILAEKTRVSSLMKFVDVDRQAVMTAIDKGVDVNDNEFQAAILSARVNKQEIAAMQQDNPDDTNPAKETHEPEQKEGEEKTDAEKEAEAKAKEDKKFNAILSAMGISNEEK